MLSSDDTSASRSAYAYWLDDSNVARYVDLLLASEPLSTLRDGTAARPRSSRALIVTTYQKDSIWNMDGHPFRPVDRVEELDPDTHSVRINGKSYRYSKASLDEVVTLLRHPEGTIPIARVKGPLEGAEDEAAALLQWLGRETE
jgi:hypothetical protein